MKKSLLLALLVVANSMLAAQFDESVLRVKISEPDEPQLAGWGSAVAIDLSEFGLIGDHYLLSAAHVVRGSARIQVELNEKWSDAEVLFEDEDYDICILKTAAHVKPLALDSDISKSLTSIGFKWGKTPVAVSSGPCTAKSTNHNKAQWRAALSIAPGCSGGAILSESGHVAGIVIAGAADEKGNMRDDITIFVPCTIVRQWLQDVLKAEGCQK